VIFIGISNIKEVPQVKEILLSGGFTVKVDDEDYWSLSKFRWRATPNGSGGLYAVRTINDPASIPKVRIELMHRIIANTPKGKVTDHINCDTLDNRRCNLRFCTPSENQFNTVKRRGSHSSKFKGVSFDKSHKSWRVCLSIGGARKTIGRFNDEISAAAAYNKKAIECYGEFARINNL
jgi:hypothetical protein